MRCAFLLIFPFVLLQAVLHALSFGTASRNKGPLPFVIAVSHRRVSAACVREDVEAPQKQLRLMSKRADYSVYTSHTTTQPHICWLFTV